MSAFKNITGNRKTSDAADRAWRRLIMIEQINELRRLSAMSNKNISEILSRAKTQVEGGAFTAGEQLIQLVEQTTISERRVHNLHRLILKT
jgi:hypothetical protein